MNLVTPQPREYVPARHHPDRVVGSKKALKPREVWSIRARLQMAGSTRDLALFNLAIDSKLRSCDLVTLRVSDAVAWYERERPGLGRRFIEAVEAVLDLLEMEVIPVTAVPAMSDRRDVRRIGRRRFPYSLVVKIDETEAIVIVVAHNRRRPGYWHGRI